MVIGEMTAAWDRLGPIVLDEVKKRTLPHVTSHIVPTDPSTQPRLRGAVTLVVQQHFGAPSVASGRVSAMFASKRTCVGRGRNGAWLTRVARAAGFVARSATRR